MPGYCSVVALDQIMSTLGLPRTCRIGKVRDFGVACLDSWLKLYGVNKPPEARATDDAYSGTLQFRRQPLLDISKGFRGLGKQRRGRHPFRSLGTLTDTLATALAYSRGPKKTRSTVSLPGGTVRVRGAALFIWCSDSTAWWLEWARARH